MTRDNSTTVDPGDIDALLAAADPLPAGGARALPVDDAQDDLCRALLADRRPRVPAPAARPTRRSRLRLLPRLALAVAAVFAISLAALSLGKSGDDAGTVWAAELVRLAQSSPLVLLDAPGWRVDYADEQSGREGEMRFVRGPAPAPPAGPVSVTEPVAVPLTVATLHWRGGDLSMWSRDRAGSADRNTSAPVLGTTARVFQYEGGRPGRRDIVALWRYDDRVLEFRAGAADIAAFKVLLAQLRRVDVNAWLSALPASVVRTSDRTSTITGMLRGVTLPPGFDPSAITGATLTKDRYQLGAAVTGTVACTWLQRWSQARRRGDEGGVREAIAAMATVKDWPILREMTTSGDYPEVLEQMAAAMPSGRWAGRPLAADADSGLGCSSLGIPLR